MIERDAILPLQQSKATLHQQHSVDIVITLRCHCHSKHIKMNKTIRESRKGNDRVINDVTNANEKKQTKITENGKGNDGG